MKTERLMEWLEAAKRKADLGETPVLLLSAALLELARVARRVPYELPPRGRRPVFVLWTGPAGLRCRWPARLEDGQIRWDFAQGPIWWLHDLDPNRPYQIEELARILVGLADRSPAEVVRIFRVIRAATAWARAVVARDERAAQRALRAAKRPGPRLTDAEARRMLPRLLEALEAEAALSALAGEAAR